MGDNLMRKISEAHLVEGEMTVGKEIGIRLDQTLTQDAMGTNAHLVGEEPGGGVRDHGGLGEAGRLERHRPTGGNRRGGSAIASKSLLPGSRIRQILTVSLAAGLLSCGGGREEAKAPPAGAPNVVLITLDTTRADHLGCYGHPTPTSPHLDRLAEQGVLFTRATSQASVTPVSHASILTGLNPYSHGLRVMHGLTENRLADSFTTLAQVLGRAGWSCAAFVSAFPVTERFGLNQGYATFDSDFLEAPPEKLVTKKGTVNTGRSQRRSDATTDLAIAWLAGARTPFHLWLHYFDPHDPLLLPPREFMERYKDFRGTSEEMMRLIYDIEIEYMDAQIGRVIDALRERGLLDNTVILVVADHGEGLGDHDWWTHGLLYREQVRVPLIIRAPSVSGGRRLDDPVQAIDIMPTLLELAGVDRAVWPPMEGESLAPLLRGEVRGRVPDIYCDSVNMLTYRSGPERMDVKNDMLFGLVEGPWKYIYHFLREGESELYNLDEDPHEEHNLYTSRPDIVKRLKATLQKRPFIPRGQLSDPNRMSPDDIERLRSLGYIEG